MRMTFCSGCGVQCVQDAKFCHLCGNEVSATSGQAASRSTETTASGSKSKGFSFSAYRSRKEDERSKFFKKGGPNPKKMKTQEKKLAEVKINVGLMMMKDGKLYQKRCTTLPLTVPETISSDDLLKKAVEKHSRFNNTLITNSPESYRLVYGDTKEVKTIPGWEEPFTLKRYKEEIGKAYSRITFYLCSSSDYLEHIMNSSDSSDEELIRSIYSTSNSISTTTTKSRQGPGETTPFLDTVESHQSSSLTAENVDNEISIISPPPVQKIQSLPAQEIQSPPVEEIQSSPAPEIQCPICLESYPAKDIQSHADSCKMWLLEEGDEPFGDPLIENPVEAEFDTTNGGEPANMSNDDKKKSLIEEISRVARTHMIDEEPRRITVRRKCIWEDFKKAVDGRINPTTKLKVVFAGEPAVDDGGPRRELFSELLIIIRRRFFQNGKPIQSTVAIRSGDFKICGVVIGMSILQGGPAANFMTSVIASYITGGDLLPNEIKNLKYKAVAESLSVVTSDDEVRNLLTSDSTLEILQELGYTGIPHKETLNTVKNIIQSLCIKDQLVEYLPQLLEIQSGLAKCGIDDNIRNKSEIWKLVFESGSFFKLSADAFLDQITVTFSESQLKKNAEIDTYKAFCDVIEAIYAGAVESLLLDDVIQWLTGSCEVPPLGFPKRFSMQFVHGCCAGCRCRPTASTCDTSVKMPIHIDDVHIMREMLLSAVKDSYGFGNL